MNVGNFLDIAAGRYPDKLAVLSNTDRWTYHQLRDRVRRISSAFVRLGVKKGDRVAVVMLNSTELIEIYLACIRVGAVFTPLNYRFTKKEIQYMLGDASPKILITDRQCLDLVQDRTSVPGSFVLYLVSDRPEGGLKSYNDLLADSPAETETSIEGHDPCQLLYTSGTTGRPKGVLLSHENVMWNTINIIQVRHDRSNDRALISGPLYHAAALNSHYTPRLALGATSFIMGKFDPHQMMEIVRNERINVLSGSPTMFVILLENCKPGNYDRSSVTTLTSGADKLPSNLSKSLCEYFPNACGIYDVYGCTECSPCITTLEAKDSLIKKNSVGLPLPFLEVKMVNDEGREVLTGEPGEIIVRGLNVMIGYYGQPEETAKAIRNGWFYTGDLAHSDEDGFLYIVDRKKDIIITGGENVVSREVEEALLTEPGILKAAVFGLHDPKWGEKVSAAVVLRSGCRMSSEYLLNFLRGKIAGYKMPKEIFFVDELPESGTGKVRKNALQEMFASGTQRDSRSLHSEKLHD